MSIPILPGLLFPPPPPSAFMTAMSALSCASLAVIGISETQGKHLQYSKFWNSGKLSDEAKEIRIPSRDGMLFGYTPALAAALAAFGVPGVVSGERSLLLALALVLHFFKRDLEVLFIHQFSGNMGLPTTILMSIAYLMVTIGIIYAQYLTQGMPEPQVDLKYAGLAIFLIGLTGNFYHHYLLSKLRKEGDKAYKIPQGGLFGVVICPHYLFEIIGWIGIALMSQTVFASSFVLGSTFYLVGRSYATRRWYLTKFDDFPKHIKALIPYIF